MNWKPLLVIVLALALAACSEAFGDPSGKFDSLEDEISAQRNAIEDILLGSLGEYSTIGVSVDMVYCEPLPEWRAGTGLIIRPNEGTVGDGVEAIVAEIGARGIDVETHDPSSGRVHPIYTADIGDFGGDLSFRWSDQPEPGIQVSLVGGCYPEDQIDTDDPLSLEVQEGLATLVRQ